MHRKQEVPDCDEHVVRHPVVGVDKFLLKNYHKDSYVEHGSWKSKKLLNISWLNLSFSSMLFGCEEAFIRS